MKHTEQYSDIRFKDMPFKSLFGLTSLLREYNIGSAGVNVPADSRQEALIQFTTPFLADTAEGFVIITSVNNDEVKYLSQSQAFTLLSAEMAKAWNGTALLVEADETSIEPDYTLHRVDEIFGVLKRYTLKLTIIALIGVALWLSGLYRNWTSYILVALNGVGIWLSWLLILKALGVSNHAADAVCSVLQEGGCDEIARSDASSLFGIFKWSEVGMAYFTVSLLGMLLFPQTLPALAAINVLCLPYTIWSITYQKFKAKVWCTMCVGVQITLWLLAICYLIGGYDRLIFDGQFWIQFGILAACYVAVLLAINAIDNGIQKNFKVNDNENS
ncbi:MAG: vitamin K epoxide reductase family protein [Muribaculaceae bacterium]|nr:vitamin K epoxide reductase family protein [Muribaculaceae bacterium]